MTVENYDPEAEIEICGWKSVDLMFVELVELSQKFLLLAKSNQTDKQTRLTIC